VTSGADRIRAVANARSGTALATKITAETSATPVNVLSRQYVAGPLKAGEISGTVKGVIRAVEANADAEYRAQLVIRVVSADGTTFRGTLRAADSEVLSSEFSTGLVNRYFPLASLFPQALTPVAAQAGDWLVVEVGFRSHNEHMTSRNASLRYGDSAASDCVENETATNDFNPWIEFSQTIPMQEVDVRQVVGEIAHRATGQQVQVRQVVGEIAHLYRGPGQEVRVRQVIAEVAWTPVTGDLYAVGNDLGEYAGDERGVPLASDRAAWDDMDYPALHARDLKDGHSIHHLPASPSDGDAALWDATLGEWLPADVLTPAEHTAIGDSTPHHARAHTLDSETDHSDVENSAKADGRVLVWRAMAGKHVYEEMSSGGSGGSYAATAGYVEDVGDGVNTTYTVTHSLNTWDVIVQVYDTDASPTEQVGATIKVTSANAITVTFTDAPDEDQYRVLVLAANVGIANTLTIEEADGTPSVAAGTLIVPNGTLTDNGDGSATFVTPDHDHSGDAGDGGTFDAANLTSGASTDGQVLTSDGAGGAAWEDAAAGGGADEFTDLTDAPASYVGQGGKYVAVKATEDGLEFL